MRVHRSTWPQSGRKQARKCEAYVSEAQAIVQALHGRGLSDGAIAALCGLTRVTIQRIRHGEQSGRNSLARLRAIAVASMPAEFGPVELELPDMPDMPRAPRRSPGRDAARQRARIMRDIGRHLAGVRAAPPASPAPTPTPTPTPTASAPTHGQVARIIGRQLGIDVPPSRPDGLLDTRELQARFTGGAPPVAPPHARPVASRLPTGAAGAAGGPWCATCPYRPGAPAGTPEYAMQRASFSCPHYNGAGCQRP